MAISDVAQARRLANAVVADLMLFNATAIETGVRDGMLDRTLGLAVDEARELYDSRMDPALRSRSRCLDAAFVRSLRPHAESGWRAGVDRLRQRLVVWPACVACAAPLGPDRIAHAAPQRGGWLLLASCTCLAVTGMLAVGDFFDLMEPPYLEAGADVVVRLRERITRARDAGNLEQQIAEIELDPVLARLLAVPEISADAAPPAGRLTVAVDAQIDDAGWEMRPWPCVPPRLVKTQRNVGALSALLHDQLVDAGMTLGYLGRVPGGWRLAAPRPEVPSDRWARVPVLTASRDVVELRDG